MHHSSLSRLLHLMLALMLVLPLAAIAAPASAAVAIVKELSPAAFLNADGSLSIPKEVDVNFDLIGWDVRLDPERGPLLKPAEATLGEWSSPNGVATGMTASGVFSMAASGGVLYVGGNFADAGGILEADNLAQFDGTEWNKVGGAGGINGTQVGNTVWDMLVHDGNLYIGGRFNSISTFFDPVATPCGDCSRIGKYDIANKTWSDLDGGLNGDVEALAVDGNTLYAGGAFTDAGGVGDADRIAAFSGGSWDDVGGGLGGNVYELVFSGGKLYAGGAFTNAGGDGNADRIAVFDGATWESLGGAGTGLNSDVRQIAVVGGAIYAGGNFSNAGGDADADYVAKFSGGAWSALNDTPLNALVQGLVVRDGVVYVSGNFTDAGGDAEADYVAKFEDGMLSSLDGAGTGLNAVAAELFLDDNTLYAGGSFTDAGGDAGADYIAEFGLPAIPVETSVGGAANSADPTLSKAISSTGTTILQLGRLQVQVPASAIPSGEANCRVVISTKGDSGEYGFSLADTVYDIRILCDSGQVSILFSPITVCIRPKDGVVANKQIFHSHGQGSFTTLNGVDALSSHVCGSTSVLSLFTLGQFGLPATGFAPGGDAGLAAQPAEKAYAATELMLRIPTLEVALPIVGVPQTQNGWDVSWLGTSAGYLYGTAFPTLRGNTVLTAHVWGADNRPGPFAEVDEMRYGERFSIEAWGQTYTYEVRSNALYLPNSLRPLAHQDFDWVTLITCQYFNETTGQYSFRRAVQAVLVSVE